MKKIFMFALCIMLVFSAAACSRNDEENGNDQPEPQPDPVVEPEYLARYDEIAEGISPVTGLETDKDSWPIMVQIANTPAARPHSGISSADLIYEIEVESTITRLTAFFHSEYPDKVGPVRSARKQQIYLWSEWDFLYGFFGGSTYNPGQNIYDLMTELGIEAPKLDGTKNSRAFFRTSDRKAPHNAYIRLSGFEDDSYKPDRLRTLYFDKDIEIQGEEARKIRLTYRSDNRVSYEYEDETKKYNRFINGNPMMDIENGQQVSVDNVIIQKANHFRVEGTVYTNIDLVGSGEALYFTEGKIRTGTWERTDADSLTIYYDEAGEEIPFKPGKTFVQIFRDNRDVEVIND